MFWGLHSMGWGGMLLMMPAMLLSWGGLIALVVLIIRALARSGGSLPKTPVKPSNDALTILKERYARGEITQAEYQQIREDLLR